MNKCRYNETTKRYEICTDTGTWVGAADLYPYARKSNIANKLLVLLTIYKTLKEKN